MATRSHRAPPAQGEMEANPRRFSHHPGRRPGSIPSDSDDDITTSRLSGWRRNWVARRPITAFLVLAFGFSWWVWPFTLANPDSTAMLPFGPIIAAFVVSALADGRSHVAGLTRALVRWRVHWLWYALALAGPFVLAGLAAALAIALGILDTSNLADDFAWSTWATLPLLFVSTTLVGGPLFEEPGWRGLLLPKLQDHYTALWSTAVVGIIWAMWHLPLLVSEPTGQRPPLPFLVWILAQAVLYTWLYNGTTGSVLLVILLHGAANSANRILLEPFVGEDRFIAVWWTLAASYSLAAAMVIWWTRGRLGYGTVASPAKRSEP